MKISWMTNFKEYWVEQNDQLFRIPDRTDINSKNSTESQWDKVIGKALLES